MEYWLEHHVKPSKRPKTYDSYRQLTYNYILPTLGHIQLQKLTGVDIQTRLNAMAQTKVRRTGRAMSPRTTQYTFSVLRAALNQAIRLRLLSHNPALAATPSRGGRLRVKPMTPEVAAALIRAAKGHRLEP